jgi:transposase
LHLGTQDYFESTEGHIQFEFLPAYAPELNPVEYLWAWLKHHALANFCPETLAGLQHTARGKLKSAQRRSSPLVGHRLNCSDVTRLRKDQ